MIGWLDIPTLSKYCCTSPRTIEMWIKERGLRVTRVRGKRLIKREWIDRFLEQHELSNRNEIESIVNDVMRDLR